MVRLAEWCRVTLKYLILFGRKTLMKAMQRMVLQALK